MVYPAWGLSKTSPNLTRALSFLGMTKAALSIDSPKVFHALGRFLSVDELGVVEDDYQRARVRGGNVEPKISRDPGVSFNPRLARLLVILVNDLFIHDLSTLRAALYASVLYSGLGERSDARELAFEDVPPELRPVVQGVLNGSRGDSIVSLIRAVIALDSLRHLHQSLWTLDERESILTWAEQEIDSSEHERLPELLAKKVSHAITLQRQRLFRDREKG